MAEDRRYLTPPTLPSVKVARTIHIPSSRQWLAAVTGALLPLSYYWNWEQNEATDLTREQAATAARDMIDEFTSTTRDSMIGMIVPSMIPDTPTPPTGYLSLNGQQVQRVAYPHLYEVVDPAWRINADWLQLPDFRGRLPIGVDRFGANGTIVLPAAVGGSRTKTLVQANLPSHAHNFKEYVVSSVRNPSTGTAYNAATTSSQQPTSPVGSSSPFDIMPPNVAIYWYVVAQ